MKKLLTFTMEQRLMQCLLKFLFTSVLSACFMLLQLTTLHALFGIKVQMDSFFYPLSFKTKQISCCLIAEETVSSVIRSEIPDFVWCVCVMYYFANDCCYNESMTNLLLNQPFLPSSIPAPKTYVCIYLCIHNSLVAYRS